MAEPTPHDSHDSPRTPEGEGPIPIEPEAAPRGRLDQPGLLEGFEEDADFDRDPEVERAITGAPAPAASVAPPVDERPLFVKAGWDDPRMMGIVGAVLSASALVAAWVTAPAGRGGLYLVLRSLLVLYNILLQTGTGVAAVVLAAVLTGARMGRYPHAAARMLVAVAAFQFILHLNMFSKTKAEEVLLAAGAYGLLLAVTFRLKRDPLLILIGCHFGLWLVTEAGMQLSQLIAAQSAG